MISLTLPFPPTLNTYWRHVAIKGSPRTLISDKGRRYRETVARICMAAGRPSVGTARLRVSIEACPPDRRARDLDNILKSLLDALGHAGIYADDSQIDRLEVVRGAIDPVGLVHVTVQEIAPEPTAQGALFIAGGEG